MSPTKFGARAFASVAAVGLLAGGFTATQAQTSSAISAADRKAGAEAHPQLLAEFGGRVAGPQST